MAIPRNIDDQVIMSMVTAMANAMPWISVMVNKTVAVVVHSSVLASMITSWSALLDGLSVLSHVIDDFTMILRVGRLQQGETHVRAVVTDRWHGRTMLYSVVDWAVVRAYSTHCLIYKCMLWKLPHRQPSLLLSTQLALQWFEPATDDCQKTRLYDIDVIGDAARVSSLQVSRPIPLALLLISLIYLARRDVCAVMKAYARCQLMLMSWFLCRKMEVSSCHMSVHKHGRLSQPGAYT